MDVVTTEVRGAPTYVERSGTGAPALFLHGVPDSADLWQPVIASASAAYRCFAPDLPGFRRSAMPGRFVYSLDGYAEWVNDLVDALAVTEPVTLVGHDWGGIFGLAWACQHPERVARVIVADTIFSHLYRWHAWARVWRTPGLGELAMVLMSRPMFFREMRRGSAALDDEWLSALWEATTENYKSRFVTLRLYRSLSPAKLLSWQGRLQRLAAAVPVTVLHGELDPYIPAWTTRLFHTEDVRLLENIGHWVPAEAPSAVLEALGVDARESEPRPA
jgi:pimeloyl-ACP methyl ester carboxylesterase